MLLLVLLLGLAVTSFADKTLPCPQYEKEFRHAAHRYLSDLPALTWKLLAAQAYAESSCRPEAISHVGAQGLSQFMPGTWQDMVKQVPQLASGTPFDPSYAIPAQAIYLRQQYELCQRRLNTSPHEVRSFALASYNAGAGNICFKLLRLDQSGEWAQAREHLPQITGRHAQETIGYVDKIDRVYTKAQSAGDRQRAALAVPVSDQAKAPPPDQNQVDLVDVAEEMAMDSLPGGSFVWRVFMLNFKYSVVANIMGLFVLWLAYRFIDNHILRKIDIQDELKKGNPEVSRVLTTMLAIVGAVLLMSLYIGLGAH